MILVTPEARLAIALPALLASTAVPHQQDAPTAAPQAAGEDVPAEEAAEEASAGACCHDASPEAAEPPERAQPAAPLPKVELLDHRGRPVTPAELLGDGVVAANFIFTTCKTICPPLTANFAELQERLAQTGLGEVPLVSISVDPVVDTPERLAAWAEAFGADPGWTFVTGEKRDVDALLQALGVFTPEKEDHSPTVLVGSERAGWRRVAGLAAPDRLADVVRTAVAGAEAAAGEEGAPESARVPPAPAGEGERRQAERDEDGAAAGEPPAFENPGARHYFTDVVLVDHEGREQRLYSDLMRGKVVVIDSFFSTCTGVCPVLAENLGAIQDAAPDRLGEDLHLLSVSVDPARDTPERLATYAEAVGARSGWYFLTGREENVRLALGKLGFAVDEPSQHKNTILIGNDRTGLWKKAFGLASPAELVEVALSVLEDDGE